MSDLNIDIICANTPAAKGRVERANSTLQERLVKELRLRGISTIDAANAFAPEFIADFNARFAKAPKNDFDAHRPLLDSEVLDDIFALQERRKVSKSLTIHYQRRLYLLENVPETRALAQKEAIVYEFRDGTVEFRSGPRRLAATEFAKDEARISQGTIVANKLLAGALEHIKKQQELRDAERLPELRTKRQKALLVQRAAASDSMPP